MWQHFWSKLSILSQVWKVAVLDSEKTFLFHTKTSNFWRSNGTYLNIFRLLYFMLTYSKALVWFCSSFNLQSLIFVRVFSNTLIVDCVISSQAVMVHYIYLSRHIENGLSMLLEMKSLKSFHVKSFLQPRPRSCKTLTFKTNSWLLQFYTAMVHLKLCKSISVFLT